MSGIRLVRLTMQYRETPKPAVVIGAVVLAEAAIVVAALRMRVVSDSSRGLLGARPAEVVWTLLPVILIAAIVLLSYEAHADERVAPSAPAGSLVERPLR